LQVNLAAAADADSIHDLRLAIRRPERCLLVFSALYRAVVEDASASDCAC